MNEIERFRAAYDYLYNAGKVHSITDFAKAIGAARTSVSKAYNGDEKYLKGAILVKVSAAYPDIFNREWIMYGKGEMLVPTKQEQAAPSDNAIISQLIGMMDRRMEKMENMIEALNSKVQKLERAQYGYASVAADDGGVKTK